MKKFISLILVTAIALGCCIPAFAQEEKSNAQCDTPPVIIVRGMDFGGLYIDYGTENERNAVGEIDAGELIGEIAKAAAKLIFKHDVDGAMDIVIDYVYKILEGISVDGNGDSVYDIDFPRYKSSAENYDEICHETSNELGMVRSCVETFDEGHTYYFNYDWRQNPLEVADEINEIVEIAIKTSGHDKVNIACASMGGIMTVAYLTKYGYEKVNRCLFLSSTFCGAQVASDLLSGKVDITAPKLYNYVSNLVSDSKIGSFFIDELYDFGIFDLAIRLTDFILDNYFDEVNERILQPVFGHMLTLWGLVQPEDYESAIDFILEGDREGNAEFLKTTDTLQKMMKDKTALLNEMVDNGVEIAVVAHYDSPVIPVYENADFTGDGVLETYEMSGYATVAKYGETLGDDYKAANPKYVSPDNVVDLSTALFPEYTYIIKDAPHVSCAYGTDYNDFFMWLLTYDGDFYAGASEKYPQFMKSDSEQSLSKF